MNDRSAEDPAPELSVGDPIDEIAGVLQGLRGFMARHPAAVLEAMAALAAEGRAFAETPDGRAWAARLRGSEVLRRARTLWEGLTIPLQNDGAVGSGPIEAIDQLLASARAGQPEAALARAFLQTRGAEAHGGEARGVEAGAVGEGGADAGGGWRGGW